MVRTPSSDKSGLKKGTWTPEEDRKLIAYVTRYGCWNWRQLPRFAGLARCGKSCRLRWMNYLRPNIKRGDYTQEEEEIIVRLHEKLGNKWSAIANNLPGRTDNEIKNHWHTTLKKRLQQNAVTQKNAKASKSKDNKSGQERDLVPKNGFFQDTPPATSKISDNGPLSPQLSSSELSSVTTDLSTTATSNEDLVMEDDLAFLDAYTQPVNESFWTEAYLSDISCSPIDIVPAADGGNGTSRSSDANACTFSPQPSSGESLVMENDFAFLDAHTETTIEEFWTQPYVPDVSHVPSELLSPLVNESGYFSPMCDSGLWTQSHFHDEYISLF